MINPQPKTELTLREAAAFLGIHPTRIRQMIRAKQVQARLVWSRDFVRTSPLQPKRRLLYYITVKSLTRYRKQRDRWLRLHKRKIPVSRLS